MPRKLAIKRLTESDLTIFEYHHRRTAGKQKAINLNADVFIQDLYPQLPEVASSRSGRFSVDLFLYGPANFGEQNLQRKIIKVGSYKNWRLNGEFIHNPLHEATRYNKLQGGDYAIIEFIGDIAPDVCKVVLVGQSYDEDANLHGEITRRFLNFRMRQLTEVELAEIIDSASVPADHPSRILLLESYLEDAAFSGEQGTSELLRRRTVRSISKTDLDNARQNAEASGERGEEFVNAYLESGKKSGTVRTFEWSSRGNAVSPFDFKVVERGEVEIEIDVKSTSGDFSRRIHVSMNELRQMAISTSRYDIYRIYEIEGRTAKCRIVTDLKQHAATIIEKLGSLPTGVTIDSVSLDPGVLPFGKEFTIELPEEDDEE